MASPLQTFKERMNNETNKMKEANLEKLVTAAVSIFICLCATFLALNGKGEGTAVLTAVAGGLYGVSGTTKNTEVRRTDEKLEITEKG